MVCSRIFQACPQVKCNHDQIVVEEGKCCPKCADGKLNNYSLLITLIHNSKLFSKSTINKQTKVSHFFCFLTENKVNLEQGMEKVFPHLVLVTTFVITSHLLFLALSS